VHFQRTAYYANERGIIDAVFHKKFDTNQIGNYVVLQLLEVLGIHRYFGMQISKQIFSA